MPGTEHTARPTPFRDAIQTVASARGKQKALVFKSLGRWQSLSWAAAREQIERAAAGLSHLGVSPGGIIAIHGEITPRLVIVAAAARSLKAELISVPLRAPREVLESLILNPRVQFVAAHGRETVAEWQSFGARHRSVPILFDHVTPESKSPGEDVLTYPQLVSLAAPADRTVTDDKAQDARRSRSMWFAETTDWTVGLDTALELWLEQPIALALPESQRAALRDLAEFQPEAWLASGATLTRFHSAIESRLPHRGTLRWLLDGALSGGRAPWHALLRHALRRRSGLANADSIYLAPGQQLSANVRQYFTSLGVEVTGPSTGPAGRTPGPDDEALPLAVAAQ